MVRNMEFATLGHPLFLTRKTHYYRCQLLPLKSMSNALIILCDVRDDVEFAQPFFTGHEKLLYITVIFV